MTRGPITIATVVGHITKTVTTEIRVATGERRHPTVTTKTGPLAIETTSLSEMKTYDIKKKLLFTTKKISWPWKRGICQVCSQFDGSLQNLILYSQSLNFFLQKYQFENKDCSHISCHKYVGNSLAKNYKSSNSQ
jgi:hypothetical protein